MITSNYPLRAGKGWLYEAGIRVDLVAKWPGRTKPGSVSNTVTTNTDIYPTVLDMLGLPPNPKQHRDGISIKQALLGKDIPFDRTLYWAYPCHHGSGQTPSVAVRKGDHKLIYWVKGKRSELYNVTKDISEKKDLSRESPELKKQMLKIWIQILKLKAGKTRRKMLEIFF